MPAIFKMEPRRSKRLAGQPPSIGNPDDTTWPKSKRKKTRNSQSAARLTSNCGKTRNSQSTARPGTLLVDLPTEILDFISQAVLEKVVGGKRCSDLPEDLIQLGQTCRRMYHVAQHTLYRQIIAGEVHHGVTRRLDLGALICSLWRNRNLGPLVRHICFDSLRPVRRQQQNQREIEWDYMVYGDLTRKKRYFGKMMKRILGVDRKRDVPSSMGAWCWRSAGPVFLLFAMAPNLKLVQLTVPTHWEMDHAIRTLRDGTKESRVIFPNLTNLRLRFDSASHCPWGFDPWSTVIGPLLSTTPNLKTLELRQFSGLVHGLVTLPPQLTSLIIIDNYVSDGALRNIAHTCGELSKLSTYSYHNGLGDREVEHLTRVRLRLLSNTQLADKLQTLALCSTVFDSIPATVMGRFTALRVLGIRYAFTESKDKGFDNDLLVNLVKDCPHLRGLLVAGAFRISRDGLKRFAMAASKLEFPSLRQVKLVCRSEFWDDLKQVAKAPISGLFRFGNVKLVLRVHEYEGTARLIEELEEDVL